MKCPNDRIDPSHKQHNPAFIKGGREAGGDQSAAPSPAAQ